MTATVTAPNSLTAASDFTAAHLLPLGRQARLGSFTRGELVTCHLEDVRDRAVALRAAAQPEDIERQLSRYHLALGTGGSPTTVRLLGPAGWATDPMALTEHAYRQLAGKALPSRGAHFVEETARLSKAGLGVAGLAWNLHLQAANEPALVRTVERDGRRVVRAVLSQRYQPFEDVELLQALLDSADTRDLPVLQAELADGASRIRFALEPVTQEEMMLRPVPVVQAWNSEVGLRSVNLQAGLFRLRCLNGAGTWTAAGSWRWNHVGRAGRIADGVAGAVASLRTAATGVVDAYQRAMTVAIDDALSWMQSELDSVLSQGQMARAVNALHDETTTPGLRLVSLFDAVTLAAQDETDLHAQGEMEAVGARLLASGLRQAGTGHFITARASAPEAK
jgi:hypothetical protein